METLATMIDRTVEQTRRPELQDLTATAVKVATLRAHHLDFFPRDMATLPLLYTPSNSVEYQFPSLSTTLLRMRSLKTLRGLDAATSTPVEQFEYRDLDDLYDKFNCRRPSIYTLVGDTLRVFPQMATGLLEAVYYANPDVGDATYTSWIADAYPDQLAMWAGAVVQSRLGFAESAQRVIENEVKPFQAIVIASHLLGNVN